MTRKTPFVVPSLKLVSRDDWLASSAQGTVLHVGCTDHPITADRIAKGRLLHSRLISESENCVGLDIDGAGIATLRRLMPENEFLEADVEKLGQVGELVGRKFDRIIAGDVLEHLSNPGLFLKGIRPFLAPNARIVITTPHAFSVKRILPMFIGREHVHPDHVAYYSLSTLSELARREGMTIEGAVGFQWINPTLRNRVAYILSFPLLAISAYRVCDELGVVLKVDAS